MRVHLHIERNRKQRLALKNRSSIGIVLVMLFSSTIVLACEELPGSNFTANNKTLVVIYAVAAIGALLSTLTLYFVRRRRGLPAVLFSLLFLFFHPVWYFGGGGGDCGMWFAQLAKYITIAVIGLLALQISLCRFRRPRLNTGAREGGGLLGE